jgi:hypothetical protein
LGEWLNVNNLFGKGVEVGSSNGVNARNIIKKWKGRELVLVDTWGEHIPELYRERTDWTDFNACFNECKKLEEDFKPRILLDRNKSLDAVGAFPDLFFDFVYIDAAHDRFNVTADIVAWWPKVKSGGLFSGHDYYNDTTWPAYCQVKQVVDDWCEFNKLTMHHTPKCGSWWIIKP